MIIFVFTILLIFCFEILIFLKTPFYFKYQTSLYKKIFIQINNEELFPLIAKDILINSFKLFFYFLISILPILIFFLFYTLLEKIFIILYFHYTILQLLYFFLRKKLDKRKI